MQTAVKAVYHDHCYVIPHKQGATSLLFPSVSGLNTRIQGGKVVVVTSPDIQPATTSREGKQEEEEELNEGIAHDHGYYHSNSGSDESQDEKAESRGSSGKSSIALDLPHPNKSGGAIAFDPTSSNMSFPDCQFSTLPAQIFAQDEEESPLVDGQPAPKLEFSPEALAHQFASDHTIRFVTKEAAEGKKKQRKTSVNVKPPPPEPVTPTRKGARQRKPSTKVREMQEEEEEKDTKKHRKRKAVINIARPERQLSVPDDVNRTTVHREHKLVGSTLVVKKSPVSPQPREITDIIQGATSPKKVKKMAEESTSPKGSPKKAAVKKRKKEEDAPDKSEEAKEEAVPSVETPQPKDKTEETSQATSALPTTVQPEGSKPESGSEKAQEDAEPVQKASKRARSSKSTEGADGSSLPTQEAEVEQAAAKRGRPAGKAKAAEKATAEQAEPDTSIEDQSEQKPTRGRLAKSKPQEAVTEPESKTPERRGRPRKIKAEEDEKESMPDEEPESEPKTPGRRGRPRKSIAEEDNEEDSRPEEETTITEPVSKTPERRGRPRKNKVEKDEKEEPTVTEPESEPKTPGRRGRPRKGKAEEEEKDSTPEEEPIITEPESEPKTPGKRGRPRKSKAEEEEKDSTPEEEPTITQPQSKPKTPGKRGRPRKSIVEEEEKDITPEEEPTVTEPQSEHKTPGKRGRPRKSTVEEEEKDITPEEEPTVTEPQSEHKTPGKRGRPRKSIVEEEEKDSASEEEPTAEEPVQEQQPSRRGRPRKSETVEENTSSMPEQEPKTPGRRGRPKKNEVADPTPEQTPEPEPQTEVKSAGRRGRPRKGKEKDEDEDSTADQEPEQTTAIRQGRSRNSESSEHVSESAPPKDSEEVQTPSRRGRPRKTTISQEPDDTTASLVVKEPESKVSEAPAQKGEGGNAKVQPEEADDNANKDIGTGDAEVVTENVTKQAKSASPESEPKKRGRGRPPKLKPKDADDIASSPSPSQTDSHSDKSTPQPQQSPKSGIPATVASTPTWTVGRGRPAKSTPQSTPHTEKAEPGKRGRKRKSVAETVDDDTDAQSDELTIRFIPNKDVTKGGNHWGQAVPSDLLLRVFQQVIAVEGPFPFLSRVSKVCRLWYEVGHHCSLWTSVDLTAPCIRKYKKSLASLCRKRISDSTTSLNLSGWSSLTDTDLEMVIKHCKNLETLKVSGCDKLSSTSVRLLATHCKHLANVDFSEAWPTSGQHDKSARSLCELVEALGTGFRSLSMAATGMTHAESLLDALMLHCPNMERLDFSNCLFGNYLMKLPLERLQEACPRLKVLLLGNALFQVKEPTNKELAKCPGFVNLETLDVSCNSNNANKMRYVTDDVLKRLLRNAFDLRQLDVSGCRHVTADGIEALPIVSLKKLLLGSCKAVTQPNFVDVILKWGHSLQHLDLSGNSIDEQVVLRLIDGCPNLSHLNLSGCRGLPMQTRREHVGDNVIAVLRHTLED